MSLKAIVSVSGLGGLYKVISQTKNGFIIESLSDTKRTMVTNSQKISMLNEISIFTNNGDKPLKEVFLDMKEKYGENIPVHTKSEPADLKKFLHSVLPDYDQERVYVSDIRKIALWYNLVKNFVADPDPAEETHPTAEPPVEKSGS